MDRNSRYGNGPRRFGPQGRGGPQYRGPSPRDMPRGPGGPGRPRGPGGPGPPQPPQWTNQGSFGPLSPKDRDRSFYGTHQPHLIHTPGPILSEGSAPAGPQRQYGHDRGMGENWGGDLFPPDYGGGPGLPAQHQSGFPAQHQSPPGLPPLPTQGLRQPPPEYTSEGRPPPGLNLRTAADETLPASGLRPEMLGAVHHEQREQTP